ncbi:cell wall integrity and stress response component 3-like isoform X1 [Portunus trituberculatus]|uniref:cell wall integrity and stress response component 3-like isoform X1 n=1 Tax=Portunus trituberculatus TaxID=210409 RepID=UPI001E1CF97A|nr:cell wall integrity and stress response component 3-like isoform X1 [Portunus trituberculatus]
MITHSRAPRGVVMVLVICHCAFPPVYTHGQSNGSTSYCPHRHALKEETQILEASVVERETRPSNIVNLHTATYTTANTYLPRTVTVHRPKVQIVHSVVVTSPQHTTQTEVLTVTFTTTALTTTTATRLLHTTTTLVPPRLPPVTSTSTLVVERPVTSLVPSVSYVTPVQTVVEFLTKRMTTGVSSHAPATPSTYTITDTIVFTVCPPEVFL